MRTISKFQSIMMALCMALCLSACSESNNDEPDGPVKPDPVVPDPTNPEKPSYPTLTESEASADLAELMVRCMVLGADPKAECNDFGRLWELMETIYHQPETRGVWSAAVSVFKFKQALDNSKALYRAALLGAMVETDQLGPDARKSIWRSIMDAPPYGEGLNKMSLPNEYRVGCEDFWKSFSLGEFDDASIFIFTAVTSHFNDSDKTPAQVVAEYLYDHNMREIDLMLASAGPIIEQGCNVVFAAGGDLISWGQTAYDYVEKNGQVILQKCKGNLTGETYADAFNTNLKILIGGLEEIYPQSGDLAGVLADFTTDQVKAFNKALHEALTTAGATTLSPEDVTWFVSQVQDIAGVKKEPTFLNQTYFCSDDMSQLTIEGTQGHSYQFYYTDRHGNVLMEGKCAVDNKYISVRVDETSLDKSCDLLPQEGLSKGGVVNIPYYVMDEATLVLWYQTRDHSSKYFKLMNDEMTESLFDELTLNMFVTGKMEDGSETKVLRATKSNGAVFSKDDISTLYFGDGLWVRGEKDFKTSSGTTIRHKIEFMLESNNIFDLSNAQRFSYSYTEYDKNGKTLNWWGAFSPVIPLDQDDQEKAVWLAEESKGNMRVTNLTCRENYKTVCNQYVSNPGTNRIEINVLKGEMPAQLEVSPKLLEFEAEGGEQSITVKKGYFQLSNFVWEENPGWGENVAFDNDTTVIVTLPKNPTAEEREAKLIVWAANKPYDQLDMDKDVCDTVMVTIRQKAGEKEFHVPDINNLKLRYFFSLNDGGFAGDETSFEKDDLINGFNAEIKTERLGNGFKVTAKKKGADNIWDISFVVNGYNGEKPTQDSYVSDLKYRWEYKTEYQKYVKEFTAGRVQLNNITKYQDWIYFHFYSEGSNINITSLYEQYDDDWDDGHWGCSMSDLNIKSTDFIELFNY